MMIMRYGSKLRWLIDWFIDWFLAFCVQYAPFFVDRLNGFDELKCIVHFLLAFAMFDGCFAFVFLYHHVVIDRSRNRSRIHLE